MFVSRELVCLLHTTCVSQAPSPSSHEDASEVQMPRLDLVCSASIPFMPTGLLPVQGAAENSAKLRPHGAHTFLGRDRQKTSRAQPVRGQRGRDGWFCLNRRHLGDPEEGRTPRAEADPSGWRWGRALGWDRTVRVEGQPGALCGWARTGGSGEQRPPGAAVCGLSVVTGFYRGGGGGVGLKQRREAVWLPLQGLPPVLGGARTAGLGSGLGSWTARVEAKSNRRLPSNAGESRSWLWRWEKRSGWDSVVRGDSVRFEK